MPIYRNLKRVIIQFREPLLLLEVGILEGEQMMDGLDELHRKGSVNMTTKAYLEDLTCRMEEVGK
jgi:hypothetical protein